MTSNANPLFTKWLTEWRDRSKDMGSKMQFVYNKALFSLRAHPECLSTGLQCKQLKGFGDKLCKQIDDKLNEMNGQSSEPTVSAVGQPNGEITDYLKQKKKRPLKNTPNKGVVSPLSKVSKTSAARKTANYIPSEGSGGYALLMALIKSELEDNSDSLGKQELQNLAQEFSTTSMAIGLNGSHYSGWNAIKTLVNKGLVERNNQRFASYFLTQTGRELAEKLYQIYTEKHKNVDNADQELVAISESSDSESIFPENIVPNVWSKSNSQTTTETESEVSSETSSANRVNNGFTLPANSYEIVLCIDSREQASGVNKDMRKTALMSVLQQNGVRVETRTLSVGDFVWIAKQKVETNNANINRFRKELLLDFVIERKRIDDLASSIKDRRWDEQKHRLINCGVRKPSYIIEYFGPQSRREHFGGIKCETLEQAIVNAQVDGFSIKRCDTYEDTVRYLTVMTEYLEMHFKDKTIYSCSREDLINERVSEHHFMTFTEFSRNSNKVTNFTVKEMFLKHLLQINGISVSKAIVIVDHYPTLQNLLDAYSIADSVRDKEKLLSSLKCGSRNLGPNLSLKIYRHYIR